MLRIRRRSVAYALTLASVFAVASANAATFTVTNTSDHDSGSLRDAITQANAATGPDTIDLSGVTGKILLTSGALQITGSLSIIGPGANSLTIDGNASGGRIFVINVGPSCPGLDAPADYLVSISGIRLTNAHRDADGSGGAILSQHSLSLDSVIIDNSIARSGGAVSFLVQYPGQSLSISNSQFLNNSARSTPPAFTLTSNSGGAVFIAENCSGTRNTPVAVTIANSEFRGNRSQPTTVKGLGGAIATFSYADITISDTRIVDNHVDAPNPPVVNQFYRGGGIYGTAKSLTIEQSEIADNTATDVTSGDVTRGGGLGLYNDVPDLQAQSDAMAVRIINSTVSGNASSATGGAMWVYGNVGVELNNSTVSNNVVPPTRTGGILLSTGATSPVSAGNATGPTLTMVSSILANNLGLGGDIATNAVLMPGFVIDASHSLIQTICSDSTCTASVTDRDNLLAVDPLLGPLAFNGGSTRTQALLAGSPAIDTGSNPNALATDQRGTTRPQGLASDMGAFELTDATPPVVSCGASDGLWHSSDITIGCTASDPESGLDAPGDSPFSLTTTTLNGVETANASTNTHSVCNALGDCTPAGPITGNKVDKKAPTITITSPTLNATYQLNASIGASYTCADGGSGVASCQGPVANGSPIDTSSTGTKTFTVNATDNVANSSPLTVTYSVVTGGGGGSTSADVGITLSVPNKVSPGGTLMYSMTITNNSGKTTANGVVVSDALPAGTVFASATASQGAVTTPAVGSNGTVTVNLGSLAGGANATINIIVTTTAAPGTVLTDTVTVSATTQDLNSSNNAATKSTTVSKK